MIHVVVTTTVSQEWIVAPRAYWKGYLRLSLVSCPIALYPATSEREKVSFNQINGETGNRIRYRKVDAETGDEVPSENIIKGYEVAKGEYIEITDEELEAVALDSTKTIDIDEFVPRDEIDKPHNIRRPLYRARWQCGPRRLCRHPQRHRTDEDGGDRPRGVDQPRARDRHRAARQGSHGHAAALPLRSARLRRIFRRHPEQSSSPEDV